MVSNYEVPTNDSYTIYSKNGCPYCIKAKIMLSNVTPKPNIIECDQYLDENKEEFLSFIKNITGKEHRTFPIIFHNGKFIGGFTETQQYKERIDAFADFDTITL